MRTGKTALYEDLKHQILTLERAPDEALDEVGLGERYGISRTPVRDVLRQLAGEGYIEHRENRGARVIPMNHATMRDFFSVAPVIYEAVARLAVQNFRPEQLVALQACQARFRTAVGARDHVQMVVENTLFHSLIGEMSGSMFLSPSYSKLLIDHARIGHTFFRPTTPQMEQELHESLRSARPDDRGNQGRRRGRDGGADLPALGSVPQQHGNVHCPPRAALDRAEKGRSLTTEPRFCDPGFAFQVSGVASRLKTPVSDMGAMPAAGIAAADDAPLGQKIWNPRYNGSCLSMKIVL
ncbi:GntR family transcriptional regulator [Paracoccus sp. (in: a-proteobacteria)]|uniref:GntR family transcriptional regulator n=1 Tax=Paracoccus sp. TaxID=267 RepID=UPI002AFEB57E|nr:GntR family transcriptional regulator [Paracoccus sp. (in: a-proteobacteria)]